MKRREMIMALFAVVTGGIPQAAWSQETKTKKPTKIGFIPLGSSSNPYDQSLVETFRQGLKRVGLVEHRDVELDVVWPTDGADRAISELLQRGADMLITCGTSTSVAAKRQTWSIPIVFISVGNPVGVGLAETNARPGQNATGFSDILSELGGKLVGFAAELNKQKSVDYLWYTEWSDGKERLRKTQEAAVSSLITLRPHGISNISGAADVMTELKETKGISLIIQPSPFTYLNRDQLIKLAERHEIGLIFAFPIAAREGALMAYVPDYTPMYGRAPFYVNQILKGMKPADLPIEEASKLELVVNLKTAKAIGLEIPLPLLVSADDLIE